MTGGCLENVVFDKVCLRIVCKGEGRICFEVGNRMKRHKKTPQYPYCVTHSTIQTWQKCNLSSIMSDTIVVLCQT